MTIAERFNQLYDAFNDIISLLSNIELYIGNKDSTDVDTITGRLVELEQRITNTRLLMEDRLDITSDTFTLTYTPKNNSQVSVRIMEVVNDELCDIAELEQSDFTIDYTNKTITLNTEEFDGVYARVIYITEEV